MSKNFIEIFTENNFIFIVDENKIIFSTTRMRVVHRRKEMGMDRVSIKNSAICYSFYSIVLFFIDTLSP